MTAAVGDAVLSWLNHHPYTAESTAQSGVIAFRRGDDGAVTVEGDAPDVLGITVELLDTALNQYVSFDDGVITLHVQPEPLRYRPLYADSGVVMCERMTED